MSHSTPWSSCLQISSKQLRDDLMTMLIAGHETTAAVLTWTVYCLTSHPEVVARVHQEASRCTTIAVNPQAMCNIAWLSRCPCWVGSPSASLHAHVTKSSTAPLHAPSSLNTQPAEREHLATLAANRVGSPFYSSAALHIHDALHVNFLTAVNHEREQGRLTGSGQSSQDNNSWCC